MRSEGALPRMVLQSSERRTLAACALLALLGLGVITWQRHLPPLRAEGAPSPALAAAWNETLADARRVDVNTADVAELERLPGVGPTMARRIIAYRMVHGRFLSPGELSNVKGIGPKLIAELNGYITAE